jgi:hypothetical protein
VRFFLLLTCVSYCAVGQQDHGGRDSDITIFPWRNHLSTFSSWYAFLKVRPSLSHLLPPDLDSDDRTPPQRSIRRFCKFQSGALGPTFLEREHTAWLKLLSTSQCICSLLFYHDLLQMCSKTSKEDDWYQRRSNDSRTCPILLHHSIDH